MSTEEEQKAAFAEMEALISQAADLVRKAQALAREQRVPLEVGIIRNVILDTNEDSIPLEKMVDARTWDLTSIPGASYSYIKSLAGWVPSGLNC